MQLIPILCFSIIFIVAGLEFIKQLLKQYFAIAFGPRIINFHEFPSIFMKILKF